MLFYHHDLSGENFRLSNEESQHAIKVLRKKSGDEIEITDGKGVIATAQITEPDTRKCEVKIIDKRIFDRDPHHIHIALAPTKNIDRTTWFVEKAIEIGIHEISFLICKNSERKVLKQEKILAKAVSAVKQSLSPFLPVVNELTKFEEFISNRRQNEQKFIAHLEDEQTPELLHQAHSSSSYCILIGPEGDFNEDEINMAKEQNFDVVKMGNKRLRTETAAFYACSILNIVNT